MAAMLTLLSPIWTRILKWAAKYAFLSALLGFVAPALSGLAAFIGGIFQAVSEIVVSLSKSPEGRVILALIAAAAAFLYLRFHYIEEGKALARAGAAAITKPCPASHEQRRKR